MSLYCTADKPRGWGSIDFPGFLTTPSPVPPHCLPLCGGPACPAPESPSQPNAGAGSQAAGLGGGVTSRESIFAGLPRPSGGRRRFGKQRPGRSWSFSPSPHSGRRRGWGRCRGEQEGETPLYTTLLVSLQRMCPLHNSSPGCWWGIKGSFYHLPGSKYFQFATLIDVNKVMLNSEIFSSSASERWPGPPEVTGCPLSPRPSRHKSGTRHACGGRRDQPRGIGGSPPSSPAAAPLLQTLYTLSVAARGHAADCRRQLH